MSNDLLSAENREFQGRAREVAESVMRPLAAKHDVEQTYPWEVQRAIREAGLSGVWIPKEYGGAGGGVLDLCLVVEQFSRACGGMGVALRGQRAGLVPDPARRDRGAEAALAPRDRGGREADRVRPLREVRRLGRRIDDYAAPSATATPTSSTARRSGTPAAPSPRTTRLRVTDPGRGARGISAFVVEKGDAGLSRRQARGQDGDPLRPRRRDPLRGLPRARGERCSAASRGTGFKHAMATLDLARPGVAAQALGLAQGALELAVVYTGQRKQFGQSITRSR